MSGKTAKRKRRLLKRRLRKYNRIRLLLAEAQNWHCAYCSVEMIAREDRTERDRKGRRMNGHVTIDEVIPRCEGGERVWENQVAACRMCNEGRGSIDADEYFAAVQEHGRRKAAALGQRENARRQAERDSLSAGAAFSKLVIGDSVRAST